MTSTISGRLGWLSFLSILVSATRLCFTTSKSFTPSFLTSFYCPLFVCPFIHSQVHNAHSAVSNFVSILYFPSIKEPISSICSSYCAFMSAAVILSRSPLCMLSLMSCSSLSCIFCPSTAAAGFSIS
mgnify:CR=1 FL=1